MSQHVFRTCDHEKRKVTVTLGYDRPLNYVFCTVFSDDEEIVYSNLDDDRAGTDQQDVEYFRGVLKALGIEVPELMFREVADDQANRIGNRIVFHEAAGD